MISFLKNLYAVNKKWFVIALVVIALMVVVGCTTNSSGYATSAPTGPIGGGCGG
jgi:hypothetical protein